MFMALLAHHKGISKRPLNFKRGVKKSKNTPFSCRQMAFKGNEILKNGQLPTPFYPRGKAR